MHYVHEAGSFVPLAQATRQQPVALTTSVGARDLVSANGRYDIDRDPMWNGQAERATGPGFTKEEIAYYQVDHLGTPQELTDHEGGIAWAAQYKAWGQAEEVISEAARKAGISNPIRFQGQYYDEETGLHFNRYRYYDPHAGRYVSHDPIGLLGGSNSHVYGPSPINWIDPFGLAKQLPKGTYETHSNKSQPATVNGRSVINKCYAGKVYPAEHLPSDIRGKYPHGVPFNVKGYPDFSRYAVKTVNIEPGASRGTDFSRANNAAFGKGNRMATAHQRSMASDIHGTITRNPGKCF